MHLHLHVLKVGSSQNINEFKNFKRLNCNSVNDGCCDTGVVGGGHQGNK